MGFMNKISAPFNKSGKNVKAADPMSAPDVLGYGAAPIEFKPSDPILPISTEPAAVDEPTIFTSFMVLYLGFFGLSMLLYPWVHAADVSPWNPMAYWTTIDDKLAFSFRIAGASFLVIALGPFYDELFNGEGVRMQAFTEQCAMLNGTPR